MMSIRTEELHYKTLSDGTTLPVKVFYPEGWTASGAHPCIVFVHGGGWEGGDIVQFKHQAEAFADKGYVCLTPAYRKRLTHDTPPQDSMRDAKSFMAWLANSLDQFRIDHKRIVIAGGSAGAHLGFGAIVCPGFDDEVESVGTPINPFAFVLFNPVINNGPEGGYGYDRIKDDFPSFSPAHQLREGLAPMLIMVGTNDDLIPVSIMEAFKSDTEALGNRCDLILYEDQPHGFFNYKEDTNPHYEKTLSDMKSFLKGLGLP